MSKKLVALFSDLNLFLKIYGKLKTGIRIKASKPVTLVLLPHNIGDTLFHLPFLSLVAQQQSVLLLGNGKHLEVKIFGNLNYVELPQFKTLWAQKHLNKSLFGLLSKKEPDVFIASTYKPTYLIDLSLKIRTKQRTVYEGESYHKGDYTELSEEEFRQIPNPFKVQEHNFDRHVFAHVQHYYKKAFQVDLSRSDFMESVRAESKWLKGESIPHDVVFVPHGSDQYRDADQELWDHLESTMKNHSIVVLGDEKRENYTANRATDLRGETSVLEAMYILRNAKQVWSVDNGLAHFAYMSGIDTNVFLGGGQFRRFLPWEKPIDNLQVYHQKDIACFGCNWDCEFTHLADESAPCISKILDDFPLLNANG